MRVMIVGAGVMGLMTARALARDGVDVVLVDKGMAGGESSWAGGGIVSPLYPWRYPPAVTALAALAQAEYPELSDTLYRDTGIDPEYFPCGMLMLDPDDRRDAEVWAASTGKRLEVVRGRTLHEMGDGLDRFRLGVWLPDVANIRNPRLLAALKADILRRGVTLREGWTCASWRLSGTRVTAAVSRCGETQEADHFVITTGAWSAALYEGLPVSAPVIRPVKGQMLLYREPPGVLRHILMADGHYVIPRRDGHVLCGSTLEHTGFDKSATEAARDILRGVAEELLPSLRGREPVAQWAGLRPGSPNGIPYIGRFPELENFWLNAGQYRNGLVLAPASCRLLADLLLRRPTDISPEPYRVG